MSTDIHEPCATHKMRGRDCSHPVDNAVAREIPAPSETRTTDPARDAGEMLPSQSTQQAAFQCPEQAQGMHCIPTELCYGPKALSRVQLALLAFVMDNPNSTATRSEIAVLCNCAANSIPRAAKQLEEMGHIQRQKGGGRAVTSYVSTRNMEVTRNAEVTAVETSELRATESAAEPETTTTPMVVTSGVRGRNMPPHTPLDITTTSSSSEREESSLDRGLGGELFEPPAKPKRATRRPKREKFYASETTMLTEPNAAMSEYAASKHLINGTRAEQFGKFRRWHIRQQTLIASIEQRWETWVDNWAKDNPVRGDGAPAGYKLAGYGADGEARYTKDQRTNVYR